MRPGAELLDRAGGLHEWMGWPRAMLTDSGGFQMVSLVELSEVTEEGVKFRSPYDGKEVMLTPERSMEIQHSIGADIMMQLDDVIDVSITGPRVEEAMLRSVRWLDRCIAAHRASPHANARQTLFPIIQGGLDLALRERCINEMVQRDAGGYAIGGLSGGEEKQAFWRTVHFCTQRLPRDRPRYVMGVGYAVDLVVCAALGADMFDCVYPTRTARFGTALIRSGQLNLRSKMFEGDRRPIDGDCECGTCRKYTRAFLHSVVGKEPSVCHLVTVHNIAFQMKLMADVRTSICEGTFPEFMRTFMREMYASGDVPQWVVDALAAVNIQL